MTTTQQLIGISLLSGSLIYYSIINQKSPTQITQKIKSEVRKELNIITSDSILSRDYKSAMRVIATNDTSSEDSCIK